MPELKINDEIKRLVDMKPTDLIGELNEARGRFHEYLATLGVEVPAIVAKAEIAFEDDSEHSILLDEFTTNSISGMSENALTVFSTTKALFDLYELLPASDKLKLTSVTVEGRDPSTVQELKELLDSNAEGLTIETPIVISSKDLRELLPELIAIPEGEEEVATLDVSDLDSLFDEGDGEPQSETEESPEVAETTETASEVSEAEETSEEPAWPAEEATTEAVAAAEDTGSYEELSPLIEQGEYDQLMDNVAPSASLSDLTHPTGGDSTRASIAQATTPEVEEEATSETAEQEAGESSDRLMSQDDLNALFAQNDALATPEEKPDDAESDALGQSELDALFAGEVTEAAEAKAEEKQGDTGGDTLDQSELDALFAGGSTEAAEPEVAGADELPDTLDQGDLDALFAANKPAETTEAAEPEVAGAEELPDTLDQSDLDALFAANKPAETTEAAEPEAAGADELPDTLDQSDLDALFASNETPVQEETIAAQDSPTGSDSLELLTTETELEELYAAKTIPLAKEPYPIPVIERDMTMPATQELTVSQEELTSTLTRSSREDAVPTSSDREPSIPENAETTNDLIDPAKSDDGLEKLYEGKTIDLPKEPCTTPVVDSDLTTPETHDAEISQDEIEAVLNEKSSTQVPDTDISMEINDDVASPEPAGADSETEFPLVIVQDEIEKAYKAEKKSYTPEKIPVSDKVHEAGELSAAIITDDELRSLSTLKSSEKLQISEIAEELEVVEVAEKPEEPEALEALEEPDAPKETEAIDLTAASEDNPFANLSADMLDSMFSDSIRPEGERTGSSVAQTEIDTLYRDNGVVEKKYVRERNVVLDIETDAIITQDELDQIIVKHDEMLGTGLGTSPGDLVDMSAAATQAKGQLFGVPVPEEHILNEQEKEFAVRNAGFTLNELQEALGDYRDKSEVLNKAMSKDNHFEQHEINNLNFDGEFKEADHDISSYSELIEPKQETKAKRFREEEEIDTAKEAFADRNAGFTLDELAAALNDKRDTNILLDKLEKESHFESELDDIDALFANEANNKKKTIDEDGRSIHEKIVINSDGVEPAEFDYALDKLINSERKLPSSSIPTEPIHGTEEEIPQSELESLLNIVDEEWKASLDENPPFLPQQLVDTAAINLNANEHAPEADLPVEEVSPLTPESAEEITDVEQELEDAAAVEQEIIKSKKTDSAPAMPAFSNQGISVTDLDAMFSNGTTDNSSATSIAEGEPTTISSLESMFSNSQEVSNDDTPEISTTEKVVGEAAMENETPELAAEEPIAEHEIPEESVGETEETITTVPETEIDVEAMFNQEVEHAQPTFSENSDNNLAQMLDLDEQDSLEEKPQSISITDLDDMFSN